VREAQAYCRELAQNARDRRDALLTDARKSAAKMMERADHDARLAVTEAAARTPARSAASDQENLQDEIAYLRMYGEVYRKHLRAYLEALLRNVDEWAQADQAPPELEHGRPQP
jgi:cell division septum initiation protein DivIVA